MTNVVPSTFTSTLFVLAQVSSAVEPSAVVTCLRNVDNDGFEVRVQEEDSNDGGHALESIGYIAIELRTGTTDGVTFEAALTSDIVTHRTRKLSFAKKRFTETPVLLASMQTTDGGDTAGLRYKRVDKRGSRVFIGEERVAEWERSHMTEVVGYMAINKGRSNFGEVVVSGGDDKTQMLGVVIQAGGPLEFNVKNDDYMEISHETNLELANGTVAFTFTADKVSGYNGLFSKDASGQEFGGHLTHL